MPEGMEQCECQHSPILYHSQYNDAEREYQVRLPDKINAVGGGCSLGHGFTISLTRGESDGRDGRWAWNRIWVESSDSKETLQSYADQFAESETEDSERVHATNLEIEKPVQSSLSSLRAIHLKVTRTEPDHGNIVREVVVANNPSKNIVYALGMVSPADRYEENHKLFEAITDGFRYVPHGDVETH